MSKPLVMQVIESLDDMQSHTHFRHCIDCSRLTEWLELDMQYDSEIGLDPVIGCLECGQVWSYASTEKSAILRVNNVNLFI